MKAPAPFFGPPHRDGNYWCGPSVLCWLLGVEYRQAVAWIAEAEGRPFRAGTRTSTLLRVMRERGVRGIPQTWQETHLPRRVGLRRFAAANPSGDYWVRVGGHFLVLRDGRVYDNRVAGLPVPLRNRWIVTNAVNLVRQA